MMGILLVAAAGTCGLCVVSVGDDDHRYTNKSPTEEQRRAKAKQDQAYHAGKLCELSAKYVTAVNQRDEAARVEAGQEIRVTLEMDREAGNANAQKALDEMAAKGAEGQTIVALALRKQCEQHGQ